MIRLFTCMSMATLVAMSFVLTGCDTGAGKGAITPKGTLTVPDVKPAGVGSDGGPVAPPVPPAPPKK